jgi:hypothetical protein
MNSVTGSNLVAKCSNILQAILMSSRVFKSEDGTYTSGVSNQREPIITFLADIRLTPKLANE